MANTLFFGDCLDVMRQDIPAGSVDLIYLDPPFNSKRLYNASMGGAQWVAFDDTWRWSEAVDDFHDVAGDNRMARTPWRGCGSFWGRVRSWPICPTWPTGSASAGGSSNPPAPCTSTATRP